VFSFPFFLSLAVEHRSFFCLWRDEQRQREASSVVRSQDYLCKGNELLLLDESAQKIPSSILPLAGSKTHPHDSSTTIIHHHRVADHFFSLNFSTVIGTEKGKKKKSNIKRLDG
jgi:hypothetical protein